MAEPDEPWLQMKFNKFSFILELGLEEISLLLIKESMLFAAISKTLFVLVVLLFNEEVDTFVLLLVVLTDEFDESDKELERDRTI